MTGERLSEMISNPSQEHVSRRVSSGMSLSGRGFLGLPQKGVSVMTGRCHDRRSPVPFHLRTRVVGEGEGSTAYHLGAQSWGCLSRELAWCHDKSQEDAVEMCRGSEKPLVIGNDPKILDGNFQRIFKKRSS